MVEKNLLTNEQKNDSHTLPDDVKKVLVGKCRFRMMTGGKPNKVVAPLCMHAGGVGEASFFESCSDIELNDDECWKINSEEN